MAGTITHNEVGKTVLTAIKDFVDPDIYKLACQGHDLLYFIKLRQFFNFPKRSKLSKKLQETKFAELALGFQKALIKEDDLALKSFFYGYITHHITDSIFHPFIIYLTGIYDKTKKTKSNQGKHSLFESVIDALIVDDINTVYKRIPKFKDKYGLKTKVNSLFANVYHNDVGKKMVTGMGNVRHFLKLYRCDPFKIKRYGYLLIDKIGHKKYEFLSYNYPDKYLEFDLNQKIAWRHPITGEKNINSVMELYLKSIEESRRVIMELEKCLQQKKIAKINLAISATYGKLTTKKPKYFY